MAESSNGDGRVLVRVAGGRTGTFFGNDWRFVDGRQWAVVGIDGAMRSALCAWIGAGVPPPPGVVVELDDSLEDRVRYVSFAQQRGVAMGAGFVQARYHSMEGDFGPAEDVSEFLSFESVYDVNPFEVGRPLREERRFYRDAFKKYVRLFGIGDLMDRAVMALSNGECRRVLLARALLANPKLLVLDDPCAGLDSVRRERMKQICDAMAARGVSLLINVRHQDEIPSCVTDVMDVASGRIRRTRVRSEIERAVCKAAVPPESGDLRKPTTARKSSVQTDSSEPVVEFRDLCISFGSRRLFDGLSWVVGRGERWVLRGENGSGKTTLLSLIVGDNPQAYANHVSVFGHRRGEPGVALADVRRRIGLVSPELQAYTGKTSAELLESALAANPELLLLDEPCMNLDEAAAVQLKRRIASWLNANPQASAICVAHRREDVPAGFTKELLLSRQ